MGFTESDLVCPDCGNYNKKSAKFCHTCGTKIEVEIVAPVVEKESTTKILEEERKKAEAKLELGKKDGKRTKMRWSVAIGGAILLAFGLVLVVSGAATGFAAMCWGPSTSVRCHSDGLMMMMGWTIFWIGLIPTIFGVRFVAKA